MIYAFIQARMNSRRLPGKVLMQICEKTVLEHIIERVKCAKLIDKIIVATSINEENDAIENLCKQLNTLYFRGSEDDVIERFKGAVKAFGIKDNDSIVRITGDCPLVCPDLIDVIISHHDDNDLTTNCIRRTFPDGLDIEVFKAGILKRPDFHKINFFEKEYDINFLWSGFKVLAIVQKQNLSSLRWTLDTADDFEFIKNIYEKLYKSGQIFYMEDILRCLS
ncbi:MAG: glycosyltransferase family protein [Candidatus Omnitrophica bacterium]|nr:glycosyltransferase family protein [Candidatus Omnitrophota bacterium]